MICAKNNEGKIIHVKYAKKEEDYTCIECCHIVFPKQGHYKKHHFAHSKLSNSECIMTNLNNDLQLFLSAEKIADDFEKFFYKK